MDKTKRIIAIGGGELRNKTTLPIDEYIAARAKEHAGQARAVGVFLGTASHDSMPYFNSFRKTYTSIFDIKAETALLVHGEMDAAKIAGKFEMADFLYIGGGDTKFMLDIWRQKRVLSLIEDAYRRGVLIAGLSAGAICWFQNMYTDYNIIRGQSDQYTLMEGLGLLEGTVSPHYNERQADFDQVILQSNITNAIGIENNCALEFEDGALLRAISAGGKAYRIRNTEGKLYKTEI